MRALVASELLRLWTVRAPRWAAAGDLALIALVAAANLRADHGADALGASLRALALIGVLSVAAFAASTVGAAFQRGEVATTYLAHPHRAKVAGAQALVHGGLGMVFAALAAAIVVVVALVVAGSAEVAAAGPWRIVAGAAAGGAAMSATGVLFGTLLRTPTLAAVGVVALSVADSLLRAGGVGPYLPFGLLGSMMGDGGGAPAVAALALLLAYLAAFAVVVRRWALGRDLT